MLRPHARASERASTKTALIAAFVGISLGSYYAIGIPNVKLTDTFDFVATYAFGLSIGLPVVILTRTIFALFNPWGQASGWLIGLLVVGDSFYALAGFLARRAKLAEKNGTIVERSVSIGLMGLFAALAFDLVTNVGSGLFVVSGPTPQVYLSRAIIYGLITMNFPLPFGVLHELTDFLFFSTIAPAAISLLRRSTLTNYSVLTRFLPAKRSESR